jgi:predicted DNA-binding transcriptional regulator AlpA
MSDHSEQPAVSPDQSILSHLENNLQITKRFWESPADSLWDQKELAVVLGLSEKWFEKYRWIKSGIKYFKLGSRVKYQKKNVLEWLSIQCQQVGGEGYVK